MLKQQKALLDEGLDINKDGDVVKVKKEWNENILADGGISYHKLNDKWYRGVYRDWETDRKSTRLNSSHSAKSRMPSSA